MLNVKIHKHMYGAHNINVAIKLSDADANIET